MRENCLFTGGANIHIFLFTDLNNNRFQKKLMMYNKIYEYSPHQLPKHTSVGLGLHSMTGQKLPIAILARLGHSITYDAINETETAQAELVEQFQLKDLNLPLQPATEDSKVSIYIWAV